MKTLKYAIRFLTRSKSYTLINLLGLAFSLACCIILLRYIHRELTVDTHCVDREKIYGVNISMEGNQYLGGIRNYQIDPVKIDERHIKNYVRFTLVGKDFIDVNQQRYPAQVMVTDSAYFELFNYPVVQGHIQMNRPESVLLKKDFAEKIFGNENPIGKVIRHSNGKDLIVEGILDEPSCKTSVSFDLVASYHFSTHWERMETELYQFMPDTDMEAINQIGTTPRYINPPQRDSRQYTFSFIPLKDIYWAKGLTTDLESMISTGSPSHIRILAGVCLLLFLTGLLNFVNIYLVAMLRRGKEYGLKKVYGASGRHLFLQIWTENTLLIAASLLTAWFFVEASQIPVSRLLEMPFAYTPFDAWLSFGILTVLPLMTSIYPFVKYNYGSPVRSIRSIGWSNRSVHTRMVFLGIQYVFTFLLAVLALFFNNQLQILLNTDPGFRTHNVMTAHLKYRRTDYGNYTMETNQKEVRQSNLLEDKLAACPFIEYYEPVWYELFAPGYGTNYINPDGKQVYLSIRLASPVFFKLFGIEAEEGELPENLENRKYLLNRSAMEAFGFHSLEEAKVIEYDRYRKDKNISFKTIDAVVKDYYNGHLTMGKQPLIYEIDRFGSGTFYIAYREGKTQELIAYLQSALKEIYGVENFEYTFLKDDVKALYNEDRKIADIYKIFALIAVIISCLGLFGISLFDIRQRYREIAIRKVNGAGMKDLYRLLFHKYIIVLGIAFIVAVPLAWYLIHQYTADFVVKAPIGIGIFVTALLLVAFISLGTLWWQIRKAANIHPATIMKTE